MRMILRFVLSSLVALPLAAHNLWITAEGGAVRLVFEHSMQPGPGDYNDDIVACGKTWVRTLDGDISPVAIQKAGKEGATYLAGKSSVADAPRSIEHSCLFGIYKGRLDYFYGQHLDVETPEQMERLGAAKELPIDFIPAVEGNTLTVRLVYQGEPLANHRVAIIEPDGTETKHRTDAQGKFSFDPKQRGVHGIWAVLLNDEVSGEHKGEPYEGTMHATSLTFDWPLGE